METVYAFMFKGVDVQRYKIKMAKMIAEIPDVVPVEGSKENKAVNHKKAPAGKSKKAKANEDDCGVVATKPEVEGNQDEASKPEDQIKPEEGGKPEEGRKPEEGGKPEESRKPEEGGKLVDQTKPEEVCAGKTDGDNEEALQEPWNTTTESENGQEVPAEASEEGEGPSKKDTEMPDATTADGGHDEAEKPLAQDESKCPSSPTAKNDTTPTVSTRAAAKRKSPRGNNGVSPAKKMKMSP